MLSRTVTYPKKPQSTDAILISCFQPRRERQAKQSGRQRTGWWTRGVFWGLGTGNVGSFLECGGNCHGRHNENESGDEKGGCEVGKTVGER